MRVIALLIVIAALAALSSASVFKPTEYANFFARFTKTFSRRYTAGIVKEKLDVFKVNIDKITLVNAKAPGTLHINGLADMPAAEFKKMLAFRAPASVYAAVESIAAGKNRDGRNAALALLQAEEDVNAPINEEALAAVDAYAATFLDMGADQGSDQEVADSSFAEVEASNGTTNASNGTAAPAPKPKKGNAFTNFFRRLRGNSTARAKSSTTAVKNDNAAKKAEEEARKAAEARKRAEEKAASEAAAASSKISSAERSELLAFADAGFDWRGKGVLGEARHQGSCGSCWAYGTISAIEAGLAIKRKITPLPVLSEQHLVDCDSSNGGCSGGWYTSAFKFAAKNGLRSTDAYGPYKTKKEDCRQDAVPPYAHTIKGGKNVFGYSLIRNTADYHVKMIKAVKEDGPVATAIWAPEYLQFWGKGIIMGANCTGKTVANHAVVVVGYGFDREKNTRFWTLRNSWGRTWGDGTGHYRMERHDTENTCAYHVGAYVPDL